MNFIINPSDVDGLRQLPVKKDHIYNSYVQDLKNKEAIHIAVLCCPDYSYKIDTNGWAEYTHESVGYGPGMLNLAYTTSLIEIIHLAIEHNAPLNIYLFYGDNEAEDNDILGRIKLTKSVFLQRIQCNEASGKQHYEFLISKLFGPKVNNINIKSFGMTDIFYTKNNLAKVEYKLKKIPSEKINEVVLNRKPVLTSLYGKKQIENPNFLVDKAKAQIVDRLIVGTYLDNQIQNGQKWYLLSISANSLIPYFQFQNTQNIPLFNLGQ